LLLGAHALGNFGLQLGVRDGEFGGPLLHADFELVVRAEEPFSLVRIIVGAIALLLPRLDSVGSSTGANSPKPGAAKRNWRSIRWP
jgi:hypothetical protein